MLDKIKICVIGAGHLGQSILGGLFAHGVPAKNIYATSLDKNILEQLEAKHHINVATQNTDVVAQCDVVLIAVKPQHVAGVATEIKDSIAEHQSLLMSAAAGISMQLLQQWFSQNDAIVRCMPNTPALVQQGATALFANEQVNDQQKDIAYQIMRAVGEVVWVNSDAEMDIVTALSGSGPAYLFLMAEAMQAAAEKLGLNPEVAKILTPQTILGAGMMLKHSDSDAATLRQQVTSPGGTTAAALQKFTAENFSEIVFHAIKAAANRAKELAHDLR